MVGLVKPPKQEKPSRIAARFTVLIILLVILFGAL